MNKFNYDEQMATQIGGGQYVTKSGGYDLKVVRAQFTKSKSSQAEFLEFDFHTREGLKLNYVSVNFVKGDGTANDFGMKMVNAIMGCAVVQTLTQGNDGHCPELFNKVIKGIVQRVDYTIDSGAKAGQDAYKFEFKLPANVGSGRTVKESKENAAATSFDQYASSVEDVDKRVAGQQPAAQQGMAPQQQQSAPTPEFADDIPF